jgi:hypothetical protein
MRILLDSDGTLLMMTIFQPTTDERRQVEPSWSQVGAKLVYLSLFSVTTCGSAAFLFLYNCFPMYSGARTAEKRS